MTLEQAASFRQAITDLAIAQSRQFIAGIRAYHKHPAARNPAVIGKVIWERGTTKLRDYNPNAPKGTPTVLVIPSLVNRFDILDLDENHSLLRFMAAQGLRPLIIDWGEPGWQEKTFSLTDYTNQRLFPMLDFVAKTQPQNKTHILGYCMGGLLAVALAVLQPEKIRSLSLMATPWNFEENDAFFEFADKVEPCLEKFGYLSVDFLQSMFAGQHFTQIMKKFTRFAELDPESNDARIFVLTEDWLNDGVPLAAKVARETLLEWYGENRTGKLQWEVAGKTVDPRELKMPAYVIVPAKDSIVTPESARPLATLINGAILHEPMLGHIGLLTSQSAPRDVWKPMTDWLLNAPIPLLCE